MNGPSFRVRVESSIRSIPRETWDACASGIPTGGAGAKRLGRFKNSHASPATAVNPFVTHDFLASLEEAGAATARTGWLGRHLLVEDETGTALAAMPGYLKNHSRGEYVFDQGWAEAYERAGGEYYPKLQVAVPCTPLTGPRLLARPGRLAQAVRGGLEDALVQVTNQSELSSVHVTFLTAPEWRMLGARGFLQRTDQQFHW